MIFLPDVMAYSAKQNDKWVVKSMLYRAYFEPCCSGIRFKNETLQKDQKRTWWIAKFKPFSIWVFFHRHWWFTEQQAKGGNHLYSSLPLVPTQEHWDIYLQLCMWDDYHKILFLSFITTRLLLNEIYHLTELPLLTKFQFL